MKTTSKLAQGIILLLIVLTSCSKEPADNEPESDVYAIKSIYGYGETVSRFLYNANGKIEEYQSFYFCYKYSYDDKDRLIKDEVAPAPDLYSSGPVNHRELRTSGNSIFTGYSSYEYDEQGALKHIKYYLKNNGVYENVSKIGLEYNNGDIIKWNLFNADDTLTQFYAYQYDDNHNVISEKQYSCLFIEGPGPELIRETTYKYDNKNNPFRIFKETGTPGLYSNTNNIIETNSTLYLDTPGIDKYTTGKTKYEYNDKGYPVKEISGTTVYEYVYN